MATSPEQSHSGIEPRALLQEANSHSLLSPGLGNRAGEPVCFRLVQLQTRGIWEGRAGRSPCIDQFGQTVSAGIALGLGAGLPEHLPAPARPDGSNPQCF